MRSDREFMNRVRCIDQLDRATARALPPAWPFATCCYPCICAATSDRLKLGGIPAPCSVRAPRSETQLTDSVMSDPSSWVAALALSPPFQSSTAPTTCASPTLQTH